ncbi:MAG: hypothetical protein ACE5JL_03505 [Dehalococcoidia bacterium]
MGLFDKKVGGEGWREAVSEATDTVAELCDVFESCGQAIQSDPVSGWIEQAAILSNLRAYEASFKNAKNVCKNAATPVSSDSFMITAKEALDAFFSFGDLAFYWGKTHYADASGGPGRRARTETGFAQAAAIKRVTNNGTKFAENALKAAKAARTAIDIVRMKVYRGQGPSLADLFLEAVEPGFLTQLGRSRHLKLSQAAMVGTWCFSRAAILGKVISPEPDTFLPLIWDPSRIDRFWRNANEEIERLLLLDIPPSAGLGYLRLKTGYSELYGDDLISAAMAAQNLKRLEGLANSSVPVLDAKARWSMDTAVGLGVGILEPEFVQERLNAEANPDTKEWARAHQAGLDIPPKPNALSPEEQVTGVVEMCRALFQEYYPQASEKFESLTA